jgi:hypothetical protein
VLRAHIDPRVGGRERAELWIDRDAPVARIAAVTDALARAGVREIVFVVRRAAKSPTPPPPRSAISDRLATIMRDEPPTSAVELADLMKQLFAACPSYPAAMHAAGDEKLGKAVAMAHGLERVTARCDCKVDLDSLRSVVWDLIGPADRPLMGAVTTTVATTGDKGVTVIRGATWADAAPAVIAAHDAHIRFVAR